MRSRRSSKFAKIELSQNANEQLPRAMSAFTILIVIDVLVPSLFVSTSNSLGLLQKLLDRFIVLE